MRGGLAITLNLDAKLFCLGCFKCFYISSSKRILLHSLIIAMDRIKSTGALFKANITHPVLINPPDIWFIVLQKRQVLAVFPHANGTPGQMACTSDYHPESIGRDPPQW